MATANEEEINDRGDGDGDEYPGSACNVNGLLAEAYILGRLVSEIRREYELWIVKMAAWIKTNYAAAYDCLLEQSYAAADDSPSPGANYYGIPCISIDTQEESQLWRWT